MFKPGDKVRFDKKVSEDMWRVFGRCGRVFEVIAIAERKPDMYKLQNTVSGAVYHQTYFSGNLLKKV